MPIFQPIMSNEVDQMRFYKLPKSLFGNPHYQDLSLESKVVYAILRDRLELSIKNDWQDQDGQVYLLYSRETLAEIVECTTRTLCKVMAQLAEFNLVSEKRQGLGKPNKVYVGHVVKTLDTTQKRKFFTSGDEIFSGQEVKNFHANDTDVSETDLNETDTVKAKPSAIHADGHDFTKDDVTQETMSFIEHFFERFKRLTGKAHPKISLRTAKKIQDLLKSGTIWDDDHGRELYVDDNTVYEMAELYFETKYPLADGGYADHKIYHFLSDGVLKVLAYRTAL